jgi:anti-anti-sigma regulatory factor
MEQVFSLQVFQNVDHLLHIIKVSGELRKGTQLESSSEWRTQINNAAAIARTQVVIFDLTDLTYWDTRGVSEVLSTVQHINSTHRGRAGIIAPKEPHMLVLAMRQSSKVGSAEIPWKATKEELIAFLSSI